MKPIPWLLYYFWIELQILKVFTHVTCKLAVFLRLMKRDNQLREIARGQFFNFICIFDNEQHKFFSRCAWTFLTPEHFATVVVQWTTRNDLFFSFGHGVHTWRQFFLLFLSISNRSYQFDSKMIRANLESQTTLKNVEIIAKTRGYTLRWPALCRRRFRLKLFVAVTMTSSKSTSIT